MRILVVEDSIPLARTISNAFRAKGYAVDVAASGDEADTSLRTQPYDLVVLDLGLPDMDGLEVLRKLRYRKLRTPVLILTARDTLDDRVTGLNLGADDYLGKPFALAELEARAGALLRRGVGGATAKLALGRLVLDTSSRLATLDGVPLDLPRRELCILEALLLRAGQVVNKQALHEQLYEADSEAGVNAVEVYVHRLRKRLGPAGIQIRTIRGLGYLLESQ
jgi:two-component system, OmpR family, response regulator